MTWVFPWSGMPSLFRSADFSIGFPPNQDGFVISIYIISNVLSDFKRRQILHKTFRRNAFLVGIDVAVSFSSSLCLFQCPSGYTNFFGKSAKVDWFWSWVRTNAYHIMSSFWIFALKLIVFELSLWKLHRLFSCLFHIFCFIQAYFPYRFSCFLFFSIFNVSLFHFRIENVVFSM